MAARCWCYIPILALISTVSTQTLQSGGTAEKKVGETAALTCRVSDFKYISQQLKWAKVDNQDPSLMKDISEHISVLYNEDRYSVTAMEENGVFTYTLTITDIQAEDDGSYKCFVEENGNLITEVNETLTVRKPVESVELLVGSYKALAGQPRQEYQLDKFDPNLVIMCKVRGSNPAPKVMVKVGDMDITNNLKREEQANIKGPTFESIRVYMTDLDSTGVYSLDTAVLNKDISCSAWLPGDEKKVATALLKVKGRVATTRRPIAFQRDKATVRNITQTSAVLLIDMRDPPTQLVSTGYNLNCEETPEQRLAVNIDIEKKDATWGNGTARFSLVGLSPGQMYRCEASSRTVLGAGWTDNFLFMTIPMEARKRPFNQFTWKHAAGLGSVGLLFLLGVFIAQHQSA